jgi:ribosomal protein L21
MRNLAVIGLVIALSVSTISPTFARPVKVTNEVTNQVRERKPIIVRVQSPLNEVMDLNIYAGIGTNINFENLGETIETMFLENKSWVGLTTNGSMNAQDQTVTNTASLIHLSPIDPLSIPGVIQTNKKAVQSGLTVITKDKSGKRKTYIFNLQYARKSDTAVALVDFISAPQAPANPIVSASMMKEEIESSKQERRILVAKLSNGLGVAINNGHLNDYSQKQINAIRQMIGSVYQGVPLMDAANQYAVDTAMVSKIILLGT